MQSINLEQEDNGIVAYTSLKRITKRETHFVRVEKRHFGAQVKAEKSY